MANYKIEELEGIGPAYGEKLRAVGISSTDKLLEACRTKKQRKEVAEQTGLDEAKILKWANMTDLFRISGVGAEYAELLEAAGVDTVKELAHRKAENLLAKMEEVNETKKLVRRTPSIKNVEAWIAQAKELPRALEY
ncbi:DUF4332 domain-containing protein [Porphyromonas sp. COT-290 OH860]|uniref:DUF4332 domain-containing protein n=1 Tax=Porphyromonas sp. COT-290 OH860 TaxID=1515615 RepID=UPI00052C8C99|nr:DUF4332 domain-containing protein [Porphyromonas sp. COT-290 OH860]KGN81971.1 ferredoxin [Porphyromonas sp. COT-290 OH860]